MANNYLYDEQIIVGKTVKYTENINNEKLLLYFTDGSSCKFYHIYDCSEYVYIEDSDDLSLLEGVTLTGITKEKSDKLTLNGLSTLTKLEFINEKRTVKVTWLGESNGYYSEDVDFQFFPAEED
jgi:hypothetical protein